MLKLYYLAVEAYRSQVAEKNTKFSSKQAGEGAVPPQKLTAEAGESILVDLEVPKSITSVQAHPAF